MSGAAFESTPRRTTELVPLFNVQCVSSDFFLIPPSDAFVH